MKNLSQSRINTCNHCQDSCEFIEYHKTAIKTQRRNDLKYDSLIWYEPCGRSLDIGGMKELAELLMDKNHTLNDENLKIIYNSLITNNKHCFEMVQQKRGQKLITVNLRFLKPRITRIDLKYSLLDKVANFGGKFGLFAQLTGCSLLAIFKIILIVFKTLFSSKT